MISKEGLNKLKSEEGEKKIKHNIKSYNFHAQMRKYFPLLVTIYATSIFINIYLHQFVPPIWFILLLITMVPIGILYFRHRNIQQLKELSQFIACYAAVSAKEQLLKDNLIEASLFANKLLEALSFLVTLKSIEVVSWKSSLKNLLYVKPEEIANTAVLGVIQDSTAKKQEFDNLLSALANNLSENLTSREYMAIEDFLKWLSEKSQNYKSAIGFWAGHPNYKTSLEIMAMIASIIGPIGMLKDYVL